MLTIDPKLTTETDLHQLLTGAIAPRPIGLISTVDEAGTPHLDPCSFFNVISTSPPLLAFAPHIRQEGQPSKAILSNIRNTQAVVVNVVSYGMIRQMNLASMPFSAKADAFAKTGWTSIPSETIAPPRIKESPVQMECKVKQIVPLTDSKPARALVIVEVIRLYVARSVLDEQVQINPHKLDLVGHMGKSYYVRASGESIHTVAAHQQLGIGYDAIPWQARRSDILTANNLGQLAALPKAPTTQQIRSARQHESIVPLLQGNQVEKSLHLFAQKELAKENVLLAAKAVWLAAEITGSRR